MQAGLPTRLGLDTQRLLVLPRWVWDGKTLQEASAVVVERGRWLTVGPADTLRPDFAGEILEWPTSLVTPGLVNWHCHLELSGVPTPPSPSPSDQGFVDWLGQVMARGPRSGAEAAEAARAGLAACQTFGVTRVHDITRHPRDVRRALAGQPVEVVSYAEVTGMARRRGKATAMIAAGCDLSDLTTATNLTFGLSPHAPYSTELGVYQACAAACRERGWPLTTHLAEVPAERAFVEHHSGVFRDLWERLGDWSDDVPPTTLEAILRTCGAGVLVAHANDLRTGEGLEESGGIAVHCPRTHAYFGREKWDLRAYGLAARVGTDSLASCPSLDVMADLRLLAAQNPAVPPDTVWRMAADDPARGCGVLAWEVGRTSDPLGWVLGRYGDQNSPTPAADDSTM